MKAFLVHHNKTCICMECELNQAEAKAIDALGRYKFQMFGYWAAIWVHLNRINGGGRPSPFKTLVHEARGMKAAPALGGGR